VKTCFFVRPPALGDGKHSFIPVTLYFPGNAPRSGRRDTSRENVVGPQFFRIWRDREPPVAGAGPTTRPRWRGRATALRWRGGRCRGGEGAEKVCRCSLRRCSLAVELWPSPLTLPSQCEGGRRDREAEEPRRARGRHHHMRRPPSLSSASPPHSSITVAPLLCRFAVGRRALRRRETALAVARRGGGRGTPRRQWRRRGSGGRPPR
jgi:hypothetical protein